MTEVERIRDLERALSDIVAAHADLQESLAERKGLLAALTIEYQGVREQLAASQADVVRLRAALQGADWIIKKLAPHEALAIAVRGWTVSDEDYEQGSKYRAMIDAALAADPDQDELVIQNTGGRITASQRREVEAALEAGKLVRFAEPVGLDALCRDEDEPTGN